MSDDATVILPAGGPPANPSDRVRSGMRLNGIYEIDERIGVGGMSEVWRAHNIETGEPVAVKVVAESFARDERMISLFRREAQTLGRINHEAVVSYHVFSREPEHGLHYLAMELVEGPTLRDRMRGRGLTQREAAQLVARIARGMQAAHDAGIVHRDLSTDNVVLVGGRVDRAKVIDFGIAREREAAEHTVLADGFAGKYGFVSPEQLGLFGGQVTGRSDIYSLGLVFAATLLRGQGIDMGGSPAELVAKRQRLPDLGAVNPGVRPLLEAMLRPDPAERIGSMREVASRLDALVAKSGAELPRQRPAAAPPLAAPRPHPLGRALRAATLPLLLFAGLGWLFLSEPGEGVLARFGPEWSSLNREARESFGLATPRPVETARREVAGGSEGSGIERTQADATPPPATSAEGPASERVSVTPDPVAPDPVVIRPAPSVPPETAPRPDAVGQTAVTERGVAEVRTVLGSAEGGDPVEELAPAPSAPRADRSAAPGNADEAAIAEVDGFEEVRATIEDTAPLTPQAERPPGAAQNVPPPEDVRAVTPGAPSRPSAGERTEPEPGRIVVAPPRVTAADAMRPVQEAEVRAEASDAPSEAALGEGAIPAEDAGSPTGEAVAIDAAPIDDDTPAAATELAALPVPLNPVEPTMPEPVGPVRWVSSFGPDRCFHARAERARGGAVRIEGFGHEVAPFEEMDARFRDRFGTEPSIGVRLVTDKQCPLVDFARTASSDDGPRLNVRSDVLDENEPLSAALEGASGAASLFVATPDGILVNVTPLATAADGAVMLELPRSAFTSGAGSGYLLMAVVADRSFELLDRERADDAEAFLRTLRAEARARGIALDVALKALRVR